MAVPQTSTCVVTLGGGASASYTMQESNWKVIDVWGKVTVAGVGAVNATVTVSKNVSTGIAPVGAGFMAISAGTQLQKASGAGTTFRPSTFTASSSSPVLLQGDTLNLSSDTAGQVEVYITLQRV